MYNYMYVSGTIVFVSSSDSMFNEFHGSNKCFVTALKCVEYFESALILSAV